MELFLELIRYFLKYYNFCHDKGQSLGYLDSSQECIFPGDSDEVVDSVSSRASGSSSEYTLAMALTLTLIFVFATDVRLGSHGACACA